MGGGFARAAGERKKVSRLLFRHKQLFPYLPGGSGAHTNTRCQSRSRRQLFLFFWPARRADVLLFLRKHNSSQWACFFLSRVVGNLPGIFRGIYLIYYFCTIQYSTIPRRSALHGGRWSLLVCDPLVAAAVAAAAVRGPSFVLVLSAAVGIRSWPCLLQLLKLLRDLMVQHVHTTPSVGRSHRNESRGLQGWGNVKAG